MDRRIIRLIKSDRKISASTIADTIRREDGIDVHLPIVRNRIKDYGFIGKIAIKKPWISNTKAIKCVKWANLRNYWSIED